MKNGLIQTRLFLSLFLFSSCHSIGDIEKETYISEIEVKDKSYQDISSDTLVFEIRDYFEEKNDFENSALSNFYSGRVYHSQKNYDKATDTYLRAETYAEKTEDYQLLSSINYFLGLIYYENFFFDKAIERFRSSQEYTQSNTDNYRREISIFIYIGNAFLIEAEIDSAIMYYRNAQIMADLYKDNYYLSSVFENISVFYQSLGEKDSARVYLQKAIALDRDKPARFYLNLAELFLAENQRDSVFYYAATAFALLKEDADNETTANLYLLLSRMAEKEGNSVDALEKYKEYINYYSAIIEEKKSQDLLIIENKYNYLQTKKQKDELLIKYSRNFIFSLTLLLLLFVVCFFSYRWINRSKKQLLQKRNTLLNARQQIREMAETFDAKENTLRSEILSHFEILKKVALLKNKKLLENDQVNVKLFVREMNKIIYGQPEGFNLDSFFQTLNIAHRGIIDRINQAFPELDSIELKICYFSYADISNSEIAFFLNLSKNTIEQKRTSIRKKLGVSSYGNIKDFLIEQLD